MPVKIEKAFRGVAHTLEAITSECAQFKRAWAATQNPGAPFPRRWQGEWRSETNGHHGELRCVLTNRSGESLEAFFRAKYSRFLRACYKVALSAVAQNEAWNVHGQADLGALAGGLYHYEDTLDRHEFLCRYKCRYDEGTFHLNPVRP